MKNCLGYECLPESVREELFPGTDRPELPRIQIKLLKAELERFGAKLPPPMQPFVDLGELPSLQGESIDDHFRQMAMAACEPHLSRAKEFAASRLPDRPRLQDLLMQSGWTRYQPGQPPVAVECPTEDTLVFDVETAVKLGNHALMAVAVSSEAWYLWLHEAIANPLAAKEAKLIRELIPMGKGKTIVGHNVCYDRARIAEEYSLLQSNNKFIDTMSMSNALNGLSHQQRGLYKAKRSKGNERFSRFDPEWLKHGTMASLVECYNFHVTNVNTLGDKDKHLRSIFVTCEDLEELQPLRLELIHYCMFDVYYTWQLFSVLMPKYLLGNPHPVTFAGALEMGGFLLPLAPDFYEWVESCERLYQEKSASLVVQLEAIAHQTVIDWETEGKPDMSTDPWLGYLDWTPAKSGKNKGKPAWYRGAVLAKGKRVTPVSKLTPSLLKLKWDGRPLTYHPKLKWGFIGEDGKFQKVPHPKGEKENCGNPLGKHYAPHLESGLLSSDNPLAKRVLEDSVSVSWWGAVRGRVRGTLLSAPELEDEDFEEGFKEAYYKGANKVSTKVAPGLLARQVGNPLGESCLLTLPELAPHGTATRRAKESLWLTVGSPKKNKIGTELKAKVQAPEGWVFVGADFDSQEMRIGAMFGDALQGLHGSTMMAWVTLCGTKEDKTDAHWMLAKAMGIERGLSKNCNYAMMYFSGIKALALYFRLANPLITEAESRRQAQRMIEMKRGRYSRQSNRFSGGTDSAYYNFLANVCDRSFPRSPVLNAQMTHALCPHYVGDDYKPSRMNWGIQTSGVDALHLLVTALNWLVSQDEELALVRPLISFHDEYWMLCPQGLERKLAKFFQIAHLWTWAMVAYQLGIYDLPASYAWFNGVNVDRCWRKEVHLSLATISNEMEVPPGVELSPKDLAV